MILTDRKLLSFQSDDVESEEVQPIVEALLEELKNHKKAYGLAAPQIGIFKRVALVMLPGEAPLVLINPEITNFHQPIIVKEGCLSIPGLTFNTHRFKKIEYISNGIKYKASGLKAIVILHEWDHCQGRLITDRAV